MNSICTAYNKSEYTLAFISSRLVLFLSLSHFRIYVRHCHWMEHRSFLNSQCSENVFVCVCVCKIQSRSTLQWNNSNYSEHVTMFNWTFMSILSHTTLYTTFHITGHVFSTRVYRMLNVYIFEFHSLNCVRIMSIFIYKLWISFWFRVCVCFFCCFISEHEPIHISVLIIFCFDMYIISCGAQTKMKLEKWKKKKHKCGTR